MKKKSMIIRITVLVVAALMILGIVYSSLYGILG